MFKNVPHKRPRVPDDRNEQDRPLRVDNRRSPPRDPRLPRRGNHRAPAPSDARRNDQPRQRDSNAPRSPPRDPRLAPRGNHGPSTPAGTRRNDHPAQNTDSAPRSSHPTPAPAVPSASNIITPAPSRPSSSSTVQPQKDSAPAPAPPTVSQRLDIHKKELENTRKRLEELEQTAENTAKRRVTSQARMVAVEAGIAEMTKKMEAGPARMAEINKKMEAGVAEMTKKMKAALAEQSRYHDEKEDALVKQKEGLESRIVALEAQRRVPDDDSDSIPDVGIDTAPREKREDRFVPIEEILSDSD